MHQKCLNNMNNFNNILKGNYCFSSENIFDDDFNYFLHKKLTDYYKKLQLSFKRVIGKEIDSKTLRTNFINLLQQIKTDESGNHDKLSIYINKIVNDYFDCHNDLKFKIDYSELENDFSIADTDYEDEEDLDSYDTYLNDRESSNKSMILCAMAVGGSEIALKSFYNYIDDIDGISERLSQNYIRASIFLDKYVWESTDTSKLNFKNDSQDTSDYGVTPIVISIKTDNFIFGLKASFLQAFCLLLKCDASICLDNEKYEDYKKIGELFYYNLSHNVRDTANIKNIYRKFRDMPYNELLIIFKEGVANSNRFKEFIKTNI